MPISNHYFNQPQTDYNYQTNNYHSNQQNSINFILNNTSTLSQQFNERIETYPHNADIKMEQNFDFDQGFSPSELSSTKSSGSCENNISVGTSEIEELNTKDLAQCISQELKRYSIPQAIFAQRVLCRFILFL